MSGALTPTHVITHDGRVYAEMDPAVFIGNGDVVYFEWTDELHEASQEFKGAWKDITDDLETKQRKQEHRRQMQQRGREEFSRSRRQSYPGRLV